MTETAWDRPEEPKPDETAIPEIIKYGGHCYDGTGWRECPYWLRTGTPEESKCMLFGGGVPKNASESLVVCNKIYGRDYEGPV